MPTMTPEQLQKITAVRSNPDIANYVDPEKLAKLDALIIGQREKLRVAGQPAPTPVLDRPMRMDSIENPVGKSFNLFPTTQAMFHNAPNIPVAPLAPVTAAMDIARDVSVAGKTLYEQGMSPSDMSLATRFRRNLRSGKSLGAEAAQGLTDRIATEDPNIDPNKLAAIYAGSSNLVDVGGALGMGLKQGVTQLGRGAVKLLGKVAPKAEAAMNAQRAVPKLYQTPTPAAPPADVLARLTPSVPPIAPTRQPIAPTRQPFTPWEGAGQGPQAVGPASVPAPTRQPFKPWEGLGQPEPVNPADRLAQYFPKERLAELSPAELDGLLKASPQQLEALAQQVKFPEPSYRPPVQGAGGQMELNFGSPMEGKLSPAPVAPGSLHPAAPPRTSPKWARQRAKDTWQDAPRGEQIEFDFTKGPDEPMPTYGDDLFPGQGYGTKPEPDIIPGNAAGRTGNRAVMDQAIKDFTEGRITQEEFDQIAAKGLTVKSAAQPVSTESERAFDFTKGPEQYVTGKTPEDVAWLSNELATPGVKRAATDRVARQTLGVEDAPSPARPVPVANDLQDWEDATQALLNSSDSPSISSAEKELIARAVFTADDLAQAGDTKGAVDAIKQLRGKVNDNSFDAAEDVIKQFEGRQVQFPESENAFFAGIKKTGKKADLTPEELAARADARSAGINVDDIEQLDALADSANAKAPAKKLNIKKALSDANDILGGNEGTSKQSKEAMRAAQIAREAWQTEHVPALLNVMKETGKSAIDAVRTRYPNISPEDAKVLADFIKIGNSRINRMDPAVAKVLMDNPLPAREVVSDASVRKAVKGSGAGKAADFLVNADIADVAAAKAHRYNLARLETQLMKGDKANIAKHKELTLAYLEDVQKLEKLPGVMLRHGGKFYEDTDFLRQLTDDLKAGVYNESEAGIIQETIDKARKLQPNFLKKLNDGITEYGINMMLYNTDTAMRNTLGGGVGLLTSPIERAGAAVVTGVARKLGVKDVNMKNPTEFAEVVPSIKAGVKAVPSALKRGVKFFRHEDPTGLAQSYARKALAVRRDYKAGRITKEEFKAQRAELVKKNKDISKSFMPMDDQSSLGFSNKRVLSSKNPALDLVGRLINAGTGAVKSMDVAQSHILLEMEKAAAIARKEAQAIRAGKAPDYKMSSRDMTRMYDAVRMHTMRQKLPKEAQAITRVVGSNFVTALGLPFMRAMIALPRYALQRSPLMLFSAVTNIAETAAGRGQLDVEHVARAVGGTIGVLSTWAYMKSKGVEFHSAAKDSNEIRARKAQGLYAGTYIKRADGTMKRTDDLAPLSYYYAAFAAIDDADRAIKDGKQPGAAYTDAIRAFTQNILSGSVYGTARDIGTAINDSVQGKETGSRDVYPGKKEGEKLDRTVGERFAQRRLVGVTVPRLAPEAKNKGWLQEKDTTLRTPRDLREEYMLALGGGGQKSIPSQLDIFGKEIQQPSEMGPVDTMMGPGVKPPSDPAIRLLDKLGWYPSDVPKTIDGISVSSEKRRALLKAAGPEIHQAVLALARDPGFLRQTKNEQIEEVKKTVSEVMAQAQYRPAMNDKMYNQIQQMSKDEKDQLRYNMRNKDYGLLEKWGLE